MLIAITIALSQRTLLLVASQTRHSLLVV